MYQGEIHYDWCMAVSNSGFLHVAPVGLAFVSYWHFPLSVFISISCDSFSWYSPPSCAPVATVNGAGSTPARSRGCDQRRRGAFDATKFAGLCLSMLFRVGKLYQRGSSEYYPYVLPTLLKIKTNTVLSSCNAFEVICPIEMI